jgi:hypothetical protein
MACGAAYGMEVIASEQPGSQNTIALIFVHVAHWNPNFLHIDQD